MMMLMMMMMMMAVFFPGNEVGSPPASTEVGEWSNTIYIEPTPCKDDPYIPLQYMMDG